MALINCPECNREVSDTAMTCPNCGYSLKETTKDVVKKTMKNSRKKIIATVIVLIVLICAVLLMKVYKNIPHGAEENIVKATVEYVQESLLSPESMEVIECYTYYLDHSLEDGLDESNLEDYDMRLWCYIYYKALNKSGGYTDNVVYTYISPDGEFEVCAEGFEDYVESLFDYGSVLADFDSEKKETFDLTEYTDRASDWVK